MTKSHLKLRIGNSFRIFAKLILPLLLKFGVINIIFYIIDSAPYRSDNDNAVCKKFMTTKNSVFKSGDRNIFGAHFCHLGGMITKRLFVNCSLDLLKLYDIKGTMQWSNSLLHMRIHIDLFPQSEHSNLKFGKVIYCKNGDRSWLDTGRECVACWNANFYHHSEVKIIM